MILLKLFVITIFTVVGLYYLSVYIKGNLCHLKDRIDGKIVLITGGNGGVGFETVVELAKRGGIIHMTCRDEKKCKQTKDEVLINAQVDDDKVFTHLLDLASMKSILAFTKQFKESVNKLDILINNAGIMMCPYQETVDGFEMQIGVNHLGHFLLTNELLDIIKAAEKARIIIVSSKALERAEINTTDINLRGDNYGRLSAYGQSKLANALHAKFLAKSLQPFGITVVSLHPGVVKTELARHIPGIEYLEKYGGFILGYFMRTPFEGAQTSICCAVNPDLYQYSGEYFSDCQPLKPQNPQVYNESLVEFLWEHSNNIINSKLLSIDPNELYQRINLE